MQEGRTSTRGGTVHIIHGLARTTVWTSRGSVRVGYSREKSNKKNANDSFDLCVYMYIA